MTDTLMTAPIELDRADAARLFATWLDEFARAVESQDQDGLAGLFDADASWRDFMAFRWDFSNQLDRESLVPAFLEAASVWQATAFSVNTDQEPLTDGDSIQGFFDFQTRDRVDRGYVHLVRVDSRFVARSMQTQIISLQEFPERTGHNRPEGKVYGLVPNRTRWRSDRTKESAFEDSDPAVLILGAGHNGLAVAARLGALDVPTLVIDKEDRVGDQWRNRYAALALHSSVFGDHLPYLPLPPTWTAHTPKDKWADWLESYAQLLDLNVWTGTEYVGGEYHDDTQRWTIRVRRPDGSIRELHPRHFFVAGGMFGAPKTPDIPGLDTFAGEAMHSDKFQDGASFAGKRALVVGAGVSAHEIAHDLWEHGADVTMLQRSATYVLSYESYHKYWNPLFTEDMPMAPEFADQVGNAVPFVKNIPRFQQLVKDGAETDKELLDGLVSAGFALEWGPDGTGVLGAHQSGRDGYQIDIGASQLVANGSVHLKHGVELSEIRGNSVLFSDGTELEVDVIVFATGYHQFWGHMGPTLGSVASKIESAYSRADDGEYANTWRRSAQPGLWFGAGFIRMARFYSQFSALMIKAIEEGLEPIDPDHPEKRPQ